MVVPTELNILEVFIRILLAQSTLSLEEVHNHPNVLPPHKHRPIFIGLPISQDDILGQRLTAFMNNSWNQSL